MAWLFFGITGPFLQISSRNSETLFMDARMIYRLKHMKTIFRIALIPSLGIMLAALVTAFTVAQPAAMKLDETKHNFGKFSFDR